MSTRPVVIYDANVLFPAQLRDLLIRFAVAGLVRAHWTDEIHSEWIRNVQNTYPDIPPAQLARTRRLMEKALPAARVTGYQRHVAKISLPDPDDLHVLAAAIEADADHIVTFNLSDFPQADLASQGVSAIHPDVLGTALIEKNVDEVLGVVRRHRRSLRRPPKSCLEYLRMLEAGGLQHTVHLLSDHADQL